MAEKRIGRQTPTQSVVIPYSDTRGTEAIELYNRTGKTAQEWQELLAYDIMAVNDEGLWTHTKFGYSVPRRNGKNELVLMREMAGLESGEKILHTAHRTATSHSAWERLSEALSNAGYKEDTDYKTYKQLGFESIEMLNGAGGKINFRTRSSKGGLGEGYDLLVIDEAQEYTNDQASALKYVVSDSKNPQTIFCGTPPTPVSSGTEFVKYRDSALSGQQKNGGWAEWSVDFMSNVHDKELWYQCNPSLGYVLSERSIEDEIGEDDVDFNIQRLGLWIRQNQKSAISKSEWEDLTLDHIPHVNKNIYIGVKFGVDGTNVAMSAAIKQTSRKIFVETIDCQPVRNGVGWIVKYLKAMKAKVIVVDGASGQNMLADELKKYKIKGVQLPTVKEVIVANNTWEQGIYGQTICHRNQPSLTQAVSNCEKRAIGSNGGFGYKAQRDGIEIALMDSAILAHWACSVSKEPKKQRVNY